MCMEEKPRLRLTAKHVRQCDSDIIISRIEVLHEAMKSIRIFVGEGILRFSFGEITLY